MLYYGSMCGTLDLGQEDEDGDDANASPPRATLPSQKTHQTVDNKNEAARSQQANLDVPDELSDEQVGLQGSLLATFHELDKEPHVVSCDNRLRTSFSVRPNELSGLASASKRCSLQLRSSRVAVLTSPRSHRDVQLPIHYCGISKSWTRVPFCSLIRCIR